MGNVLFIVWRESLEAVLIIGILHSFMKRTSGDAAKGLRFIWSGVAVGVALSVALGWVTVEIQDSLQGARLDYFQTAMLFLSAALMTQMVVWMNKHGRKMKKELESSLSSAMSTSGFWGVSVVAALAVAREGTETVIYLYGLSLESSGAGMAVAAFVGFVLALFTAWTVSRGIRFLDYGRFFKITSLVLLLSASALVVTGTNRLIEMDFLPSLVNPVWNTSWLLSGSGVIGGIISAFTGYRPRPSLMLVMIYALYWVLTLGWIQWESRVSKASSLAAVPVSR